MVCERFSVLGDKAVCQRGCVAKLCVKDGVWQVVGERWCVTKLWVTKLCVKEGV